MKAVKSIIRLLAALAILAAVFPLQLQRVTAHPAHVEIDRNTPYIPGEVVVTFMPGRTGAQYKAQATALAGQVGAAVANRYDHIAVLSFDPSLDVETMAQAVLSTGQAVWAQPNYLYWVPEEADAVLGEVLVTDGYDAPSIKGGTERMTWDRVAQLARPYRKSSTPAFPNEFPSGRFWGWDWVQADLIWNNASASPTVCVLDTGVQRTHPDLSGRVINGYDFVNADASSDDDNGHGTHVAGIIAAKLNNGTSTAMGISNRSVLAVKVLNAQGYGSSYSVAAGLLYCARNASVAVINMSLGSTAKDKLLWDVMKFAINPSNLSANGPINQYRKLIVAAAGNESSSTPVYPAAWSNSDNNGPNGESNTIAGAVLSVGGGRAPWPYQLWVDKNGDRLYDSGEFFAPEQCATGLKRENDATGSNYGLWVDLIAPSDSIFSTTPYNAPFYLNHSASEPVAAGYDYLSGTSMAAAFVSAGAARVMSIIPTTSLPSRHIWTKSELTSADNSDVLEFAVDGHDFTASFDYRRGYNNPAEHMDANGDPVEYGVPFDRDGDDELDTIMAPYCWPGWAGATPGEWNEEVNMAVRPRVARYLNIAKAMKRGGIVAEVKDALTGLPVNRAFVYAYQLNDPSGRVLLRDSAMTTASNSLVMLINLPVNPSTGYGDYRLDVSYAGATVGITTFNTMQGDPLSDGNGIRAGNLYTDGYNSVSLPRYAEGINFVLDWTNPEANLDMFLWLPSDDNQDYYPAPNPLGTRGGIIGAPSGLLLANTPNGDDPSAEPTLADNFLGAGTLLDPSKFMPVGFANGFSPFAAHRFDGGADELMDPMGNLLRPGSETITVKYGAYSGVFNGFKIYKPYYYKPYSNTSAPKYQLWVTDYSKNWGGGRWYQQDGGVGMPRRYLDTDGSDYVYPAVRIWIYGKIVKTLKPTDIACTDNEISWWHVLTMDGTQPDWTGDASLLAEAECVNDTNMNMGSFPYGNNHPY